MLFTLVNIKKKREGGRILVNLRLKASVEEQSWRYILDLQT